MIKLIKQKVSQTLIQFFQNISFAENFNILVLNMTVSMKLTKIHLFIVKMNLTIVYD